MFGGTVIGEGTYGCAVNPPFLCRGQARNERKENKVGKITLYSDAKTELDISKILRKANLWKNYFVLTDPEQCAPIEKGRLEDWQDCKITAEYKKKELLQVTSDFGGTALGGMDLRPDEFDFFHFMNHLLEAGALLALQGVIHYDLHRSNILLDESGVPRLLDFGMAFEAKLIDDAVLGDRWKVYDPKYDSEPPEISIITGVRKEMQLPILINECVYQKPVLRDVEYILGVPRKEMVQELHSFFHKSKSFQAKDWSSFFKTYWPTFDSFALGAVLLNVLKIQLTWPTFNESEEWQTNGELVYDILKKLLRVSPSDRYDCVEALALLNPKSVVLKGSGAWLSERKKQREE